MILEWPQITLVLMMAIEFGLILAKHGEMRTGLAAHYNVWIHLVSVVVLLWILYEGGFFTT